MVAIIVNFLCKVAEKVKCRKLVLTSTVHSRIRFSKVEPVEEMRIKVVEGSGDNKQY